MKKITVSESELDEQTTVNISLQLTSHFMYGLYDFDPEKMVEDICREYNLELVAIHHPHITLKDDEGNTVKLLVSEENYGY